MISKHLFPARTILSLSRPASATTSRRLYTTTPPQLAKNRIFNPVRTEEEFETLSLLSASSRQPLITLWTASWCPTCPTTSSLLHSIITSGCSEDLGGVGFAEVQLDSPTIGDLVMRYAISSVPTLMAFDRQEAQLATRVTRAEEMRDRRFLEEWVRREAARRGEGGAGGTGRSLFSGLFGGQNSG